jgi:hypothetical protein
MRLIAYASGVGSKYKNKKLGFYHGITSHEELKSYDLKCKSPKEPEKRVKNEFENSLKFQFLKLGTKILSQKNR